MIPWDGAIHLSSVYRRLAETEAYRARRSGHIRLARLIANKPPLQRPLPVPRHSSRRYRAISRSAPGLCFVQRSAGVDRARTVWRGAFLMKATKFNAKVTLSDAVTLRRSSATKFTKDGDEKLFITREIIYDGNDIQYNSERRHLFLSTIHNDCHDYSYNTSCLETKCAVSPED